MPAGKRPPVVAHCRMFSATKHSSASELCTVNFRRGRDGSGRPQNSGLPSRSDRGPGGGHRNAQLIGELAEFFERPPARTPVPASARAGMRSQALNHLAALFSNPRFVHRGVSSQDRSRAGCQVDEDDCTSPGYRSNTGPPSEAARNQPFPGVPDAGDRRPGLRTCDRSRYPHDVGFLIAELRRLVAPVSDMHVSRFTAGEHQQRNESVQRQIRH